MSAQRQMLIDHNIDDVLLGRLVSKSNTRFRTIDETKNEQQSKSKNVNKVLRRAHGFWLLESKKLSKGNN
jgi:hypothetical protein